MKLIKLNFRFVFKLNVFKLNMSFINLVLFPSFNNFTLYVTNARSSGYWLNFLYCTWLLFFIFYTKKGVSVVGFYCWSRLTRLVKYPLIFCQLDWVRLLALEVLEQELAVLTVDSTDSLDSVIVII